MAVKTSSQPAPQRQTVLTFASPSVADILFYETVDGQRIGTAVPDYGTPHPDTRKWPNHKLVFIQNDDETGQILRYYYAADREAQDRYNYELTTGERLVRTYVIPRSEYPGSFVAPTGGTPDMVFTAYGFVGESLVDIGEPLSGHYVAIQRVYTPINTYEFPYRESIDGNVKVTRTLKPAGYELSDDSLQSVPGTVYEVAYGNEFHNVLIKTEEGIRAPTSDTYNYKLVEGEVLERYYIIERTDYPTSYPVPVGGTPDSVFAAYGFVSDSLIPIESEIQGGLVRLVRRYGRISVSASPYDQALERNITVTQTLIPADATLAGLSLQSGNGITYEIRAGNEFHQVLLTTDSGLTEETFPVSLVDRFSTIDRYPFPPKLTSITFRYVYAAVWEVSYNAGEEPRSSRSEDSQIQWGLIEPKRGPYKVRLIRKVCTDSTLSATIDQLYSSFNKLPETKRETILEGYAAARYASMWTQASIQEYVVPESYHTSVVVNTSGAPPSDPTLNLYGRQIVPSALPATTGFSGDLVGEYLVDISVKDTTADLKEVIATVLVLSGIY